MKSSLVLIVFFLSRCESAKLPQNFQKCNRQNPDFKTCVLEAAQNGLAQLTESIEEIDMPSLNPLDVTKLKVGTRSEVLSFDQRNCKLFGIASAKLGKFEFDFDKKILYAEGVVPHLKKFCDYFLMGKLLLLPINAVVASEVNISNMSVTASSQFEETKVGNETFLRFGPTKLTIEPGFMTFHFDNIFKDDQIGDKINEKFNGNWRKVFGEFQEEYEENFGLIVEDLFNKFFSKVPLEEAFGGR